jgi:hypothetical protein
VIGSGVLIIFLGIFRLIQAGTEDGNTFGGFATTVMGITLLAAGADPEMSWLVVGQLGTLAVAFIGAGRFFPRFERWHSILPIFILLMAVGLPATAGVGAASFVAQSLLSDDLRAYGVIVGCGMTGLALIFLERLTFQPEKWTEREGLIRFGYNAGVVLFLLSYLAIGIVSNGVPSLYPSIYFAVGLLIVLGLHFAVLSRFRIRVSIQELNLRRLVQRDLTIPEWLDVAFRGSVHGVRILGNVFEGESGMLWVFVILQLMLLFFGRLLQ